jgi:hypothetical protein
MESGIYAIAGWDEPFVQEVFQYLDFLRETGCTNMFGASPFLEDEFDLNRSDAKKFLLRWMDTYAQRQGA